MEVKASCRYNYDAIKALNHLVMFKKANPKSRMIFYTVSYIIILSILGLETLLVDVRLVFYVSLGLSIFILLILYFYYFFVPKIQFRSMYKVKNLHTQYTFTDDEIRIVTTGTEYQGESKMEYTFFFKVYETSKYLFMFENNRQTIIVDKSTIENGTMEQIRSKFAHLNKKYVICKY